MKNTVPMVVSEKSFREVFSFAEDNSALAKNLYNAALFGSGRYLPDGERKN